jgi:hypothetical protein
LERVSRSFAFCIARLEGEMRHWVGLSYLLCRMLDTVEDAPWSTGENRSRAFASFHGFLLAPPDQNAVSLWADSFPVGIDPGERGLLQDAFAFFSDLHDLPEDLREKIRKPVLNMYRGMRFFLERSERGKLRLHSLAEVNQYCFFVAGLVGDLLTELVTHRWPAMVKSRGLYVDAHHFGLFLQKINLLKDQAKDEKAGRYLVPSRAELLGSLKRDADGALRYLQALPIAERGFRLFCAWSLFLGLASLPWIERSRLLGIFQRIPRLVTESLLARVEKLVDDNQALLRLFAELLPPLPTLPTRPQEPAAGAHIPWMEGVYSGSMGQEEFRQLGLCV